MLADLMYENLSRCLAKNGWKSTPEPNTYCSGKKNNQCLCVSGCFGYYNDETFINIIVNESNPDMIKSITLGVLSGNDFSSRKDCYRIDFDLIKGWHLDTKTGKHLILPKIDHKDINCYDQIIRLICTYGVDLPSIIVSVNTQRD